jgi:uncharacterized membrane protein
MSSEGGMMMMVMMMVVVVVVVVMNCKIDEESDRGKNFGTVAASDWRSGGKSRTPQSG